MKRRHYTQKYGFRKKKHRGRTRKYPDLRPAADPVLKKTFAKIGVPAQKPFEPDPFQLEALSLIDQGDCLVTAPTGAGKTWIAEQAISRILKRDDRAWYATPLKALTNSKYKEFSEQFGADRVGILTGDRKENPDAPIIVGTTEILRNQLYDAMHRGSELSTDFVVLDEAHYLGDEERGVVWEETMIYLPYRIPLLLLSATIGNAEKIAAWLSSVRGRPCHVVEESHRPVPLFPLFLHPSGTLVPLVSTKGKKQKSVLHKKVRTYLSAKRPLLMAPPSKLPPFGDILKVLKKFRLLPAIFFLKSRADCDHALDICRNILPSDPDTVTTRRRRIHELAAQSPHITHHRQRDYLEKLGVGAHHAGQLPVWKLLLETLMNEGHMNAIFATSTVAAGVNFPARTVAFMNSDRFNGRHFLPLDSTEFHQMTGRAGRRGMDRIGFAVALPGKFMDLKRVAGLLDSPPSDVFSRIHINFSMVLNLLLSHTPEQIEDLLTRSFAAYLIREADGRKEKPRRDMDGAEPLIADFHRHLTFLIEKGYVNQDGTLTKDGVWASQLRVDQPLLIGEGFRIDAFPSSDPALIAAVIASLVSDRESKEKADIHSPPQQLLDAFLRVKKSLHPIMRHMASRGFETRPLSLRPAFTLYQWVKGEPWEKVRYKGRIEDGDLVMLVLRTADHLRHIRALKSVFPKAAESAQKAIELMLREPVTLG